MTDLQRRIYRYLVAFLSRKIGAEELHVKICQDLQSILDSGDKQAITLANETDAILVEFGESLVDELGLVETIERLVRDLETSKAIFQLTSVPESGWNLNLQSLPSGQVLDSTVDIGPLKVSA